MPSNYISTYVSIGHVVYGTILATCSSKIRDFTRDISTMVCAITSSVG